MVNKVFIKLIPIIVNLVLMSLQIVNVDGSTLNAGF
jgi:hypothetical protein